MRLLDLFSRRYDGRAGDMMPPAPRAGARLPPGRTKLAAIVGTAAAGLIAVVAQWEGKRNEPYQDIVGVWTVCYGETNTTMRRYSDGECKDMLAGSLAGYAEAVMKRNPELRGHDPQVIAATSLAYNIGPVAYSRSTVAKRFSAGDWRGACDAFLAWSFAGGKQVQGLLNRRRAERDICMRNLP